MHRYRGRRATLRGKRVAFAVAAAFLPWGHAYALPTGENVVHGDVTVTRPTTELMQINQGTQKGIVNWQGFSIGASEHVNITQPNAGASLLNRVVGNNPSEIFGRMTANGQVFLVNNAGVLFAPSASVEVGSLVASTLSITDQNFLNNNYQFFNPGNAGSVVNQGSIVTANGYTALIGPQVRNDGVILAQSGKVALGAGERVTLDMVGDGLISISVDEAAFNASVVNTGTIQADGGTVMLKAQSANALLDTVINTSGVIRANALVERNGEIVLDGGGAGVVAVSGTLQAPSIKVVGDKVGLLDGARVDASGDAGGGSVLVNGNAIYVAADASVTADALQSGDGGRVILWSSDSTQIHGTVSARGAADGAGGFVETSGGYLEITRAPEVEAGGTWLIDPYNITVVLAGLVNNTGAPNFTPTGNDSQVAAGLISGQLNTGTNVILDTGGAGSPGAQPGNITVNAFILKTVPNASSLTLNAANDVTLNAPISMGIGTGSLNVNAGRDFTVNNTFATAAGMTVNATGTVRVQASAPGISASLNSGANQTITSGAVEARALAGAGNASIFNGGGTQTINTGTITLANSPAGGNNSFAGINGGRQRITATGDVMLTAGASGGTLPGVRIGGGTGSATDLVLNARDLTLNAGAANNGVGIGSSASGTPFSNTITINARNVTLNAGAATGAGVRIGSSSLNGVAGGDITVNATGNIQLNGTEQPAAIRTLGNVRLQANNPGGTIGAMGNGLVQAGTLTTSSHGTTNLTGPNLVSTFNASSVSGDVRFNNIGPLALTGINAGGAIHLTNNGALSVTGQVLSTGTMNVDVVGALTLDGNTQDAMLISNGGQTISAQSVNLTAQNGRRANIENRITGNQSVTAATGDMNLQVPGAFGVAQIVNTAPGGNQTISVSGQLNVLGGVISPTPTGSRNSGIFKQAPGGLQTVSASGITLQGASSGTQAGALINSQGDQVVDVTGGNINLIGGSGGVTNNAVIAASAGGQQKIYVHDINMRNGSGGTDTVAGIFGGHQLIDATGNVTLTSEAAILGTAPGGPGVRIGAPGASTTGTDLTLLVGGNLVLQGGTANENGAAIGSSGAVLPALPNTINIAAGGDVILNAGNVSNTGVRIGSGSSGTAGGNISIEAGGSIQLNGTQRSAAIRTLGDVTLEAASISEAGSGFILANTLRTTTSGDTSLNGPNQISSFNASSSGGSVSLNNTGALTVTGLNAAGDARLTNNGAVSVTGGWFSSGETDIATTGGNLTVTSFLTGNGGMTLDVGGTLTVSNASVQSNAGQTIVAQSVDVVAQGGGFASIFSTGGDQQITINGGGTGAGLDVRTLASGGLAQVGQNTPGFTQRIEVTDASHISVDGAGPSPFPSAGAAIFSAGAQTLSITGSGTNAITVGSLGARGASNIGGPSQSVTAGLAGEQGSITIVGSDAQRALAGFVTNPVADGTQNISTSGTISITGGRAAPQLGNFPAGIFHNGTGQQTINAARLELRGGPSGSNNAALINVPGGGVPANAGAQLINVSGDIDIAAGPGGNAGILGSGVRQQTIFANNIYITNSAGGGINSVGFIQGGHQEIHAAGDVTLTARASGGDLPGVRIGGNSTNPTDLRLFVGGDLVLTAGTAVNNGVGIGSTASVGGLANDIYIEAGGSVILNSGTLSGTGARIGSPAAGTGPGTIEIRAGGGIELNGATQSTAIRTLGTVTLHADHIVEGANGFVIAGTLNTATKGDASLTGPNQVSNFSAASAAGDVVLNNTAPLLTVTSITAQGISISQSGALDVVGNMTSTGSQTISATGDITIGADDHAVEVRAGGPITMSSGGNLAVAAGAAEGAHALVFSSGDINLTVGGFLTIDGSPGAEGWARIQTETRDSTISVFFPNLSSGGYFVNGVEGRLRDGHTGFLSGNGVAAPGHQFITTYGAP